MLFTVFRDMFLSYIFQFHSQRMYSWTVIVTKTRRITTDGGAIPWSDNWLEWCPPGDSCTSLRRSCYPSEADPSADNYRQWSENSTRCTVSVHKLRDYEGSRNTLYPSQKAPIWHEPLEKELYGKCCDSSFTRGVPNGKVPQREQSAGYENNVVWKISNASR